MKNYIRTGNTMPIVAPLGGVETGQPVLVGDIVGVAAVAAQEGAATEVHIEGVFDLPKVADDIDQGALVYFDATAGNFTTDPADNAPAGIAFRAAVALDGTVQVKLTPGAGFRVELTEAP
ncbi:DUF2190 family protein [Oceanibaculum sp.]|uniref:DUF2190 family protein n=1 Tax=Oceanibaculum sp. TaxID=1903597 RepID=UPI0025876A19|nr:DUF2190 family protein [Oceanibaculum sp.]MCH2394320.1 DUF2190 family protein [Oceanibaculum sp.]